MAAVPMRHMWK